MPYGPDFRLQRPQSIACMDLLSELLSDVHIEATVIGRFGLGSPFHLGFDYEWPISFVVLGGRVGWRGAQGPVHWLGPGDAVLGLRNASFELASDFGLLQTSIEAAWQAHGLPLPTAPRDAREPIRMVLGGSGACSEVLAIGYSFANGLRHPLLHALPNQVLVPAVDARQSAAVQGAVAFLNSEGEVAQPGYAAMAAHFGATLFLGLLRSHAMQTHDNGVGAPRALRNPRLHAALSALHAEPSRAWTVKALAQAAAMSRSVFARRFAEGLGMPPMAYTAAVRMHLARRRLETEQVPIGLLAEQLGYRSDRAFRQAFQRSVGSSPRAWRRQQREGDETLDEAAAV